MKRILILTASFGDGHNAAARNLREAIEILDPEAKAEVQDLFASTYGVLNGLMKQAYQGMVRYAPRLWSGMFSMFDNPALFRPQINSMSKLRETLAALIEKVTPDVIVSTYPVYAHLIDQIYREEQERPFRFITIITDSISVCSAWYRAASDLFVVANNPTADVLIRAGVSVRRVRVLGFPVSPLFAQNELAADSAIPARPKVLYVINTGKARAGKSLDRLLKLEWVDLTITVGRDTSLKAKLAKRLREYGDRVRILGWTNHMPQLLMSHHLLIGKAGGAMVQEAIAARCPMIVNQVIPGQEEGNAKLIEILNVGAVAEKKTDIGKLVKAAFAGKGHQWRQWRDNLRKVSRPDSALQIAELVLGQPRPTDHPNGPIKLFPGTGAAPDGKPEAARRQMSGASQLLLCDFHIHTNYSDGHLTLQEVIDFYGRRKFDCICVTDHVIDPRRCKGRFDKLPNLTLSCAQLDEYFDLLEKEKQRSWRKYGMLVMSGLEFNTAGATRKTSSHLLAVDLHAPIAPSLGLAEIIAQIHAQDALAIASQPHTGKTPWGKDTLFLWEHYELYAPLLDAWEVASRVGSLTPHAGLQRPAFVANSDFHKPKHICSWKTLLRCERDRESIKDCIRRNEQIAMVRYKDGMTAESFSTDHITEVFPGFSEKSALPGVAQ